MHSKSNRIASLAQETAFIDDATVNRLLLPAAVLAVIPNAFRDPLIAPPRLTAETSDNGQTRTLLVMPAVREGGVAIVKVVTALRGDHAGLSSHLLVLDPTGAAVALVEAHQLTAKRTAAASVLAAKTIGVANARHLAVIGAGRQARAQIAAYIDALPIEEITLWARRRPAAEALAAECARTGIRIRIASTPDEAAHQAQIVSCVTSSETPLITGHCLNPGTHVDLVGGFRPNMREADDEVLRRATIVADTPVALTEAGDLVQPLERGVIARDAVLLLADLLRQPALPLRGDITLFKSVGHAAVDLVAVELLLERLRTTNADRVWAAKPYVSSERRP